MSRQPRDRRGGQRRGHDRQRDDRLVVGLHPVRELLRAGQPLHSIHIAASRDETPVVREIRALAGEQGVPVHDEDRDRVDQRAGDDTHQGLVALAPPFAYVDVAELLTIAAERAEPALLVALDNVTDPHNLGSIARTAEAVGAHGLVIPSRRAADVTPTAEKAAAGALAHLRVAKVTNLVRTLRDLGREGVWSVGLDADGPEPIDRCRLLTEPVVLVVGAEGRGLAQLTRDTCDETVHLPMRGRVGSLNASVAAAVALYAVLGARASGG